MKYFVLFAAMLLAAGSAKCDETLDVEQFQVWEQSSLAKARNGKLKWSEYFNEAFNRVSNFPSHPDKIARLQLYSEAIPIARKMESAKLTKLQYEDELRKIYIVVQSDHDRNMKALASQQRFDDERLKSDEAQARVAQQRAEADRREAVAAQVRQAESEKQLAAYRQQLLESQNQAIQMQQRQLAEQKKAERDRGIDLGLQLLKMGAPKPASTITCNTDKLGNGLQTICR